MTLTPRLGDTYAAIDDLGNDPASHLKTYAYIEGADNTEAATVHRPGLGTLQWEFKAGETVRLSG
jgi:hypothetical protein